MTNVKNTTEIHNLSLTTETNFDVAQISIAYHAATSGQIPLVPSPLGCFRIPHFIFPFLTHLLLVSLLVFSGFVSQVFAQSSASDPTITISRVNSSVIEGNSAWFKITASAAPSANLPIEVLVGGEPKYVRSPGTKMITLDANTTETYFKVDTQINVMDPTGNVTATLQNGSDYMLGTRDITASISVTDIGPKITASASVATVTEGESVTITVTADSAPTRDLYIPFNIGDTSHVIDEKNRGSGDVLPEFVPRYAILKAGMTEATVSIPTDDDDLDESGGFFTLFPFREPNSNFEVLNHNPVQVVVIDNDDKPVFSIEAVSADVPGGGYPTFKISTPNKSAFNLPIGLSVTTTGHDYIDGTAPSSITFDFGETETLLVIPTKSTQMNDTGSITVEIQQDTQMTTRYDVASSPNNSATVTIIDTVPEVAFTGINGGSLKTVIREGEDIVLGVALGTSNNMSLSYDLEVYIALSDGTTSTFLDGTIQPNARGKVFDEIPETRVVIPAGSTSAVFRVKTSDDNLYTSTQKKVAYEFEHIRGSHYRFERANAIVGRTISISENDSRPTISVEKISDDVVEGDPARFRISLTPNGFDGDLDIMLNVAHTGNVNYIRGITPTMITLPSGDTETILEIPTIQNADDMTGSIMVNCSIRYWIYSFKYRFNRLDKFS